ncbi:MAG: L-lactate dehydrogenase [Coriobacteriales bacterium]|nr:L-lactate dehydrogenase [Coriobacteriales bacterium]
MAFRNSKAVIVGVGNVGATTAYSFVNQMLCEELVLIDVNHEKALAEAMDIQHSVYFMNRNMHVRAGDYADCADADLVVISASAPMPKDSTDRLQMLKPSMGLVRSIVDSVMGSGFKGIFIVVSNPVDVMTYYTWKLSGLPARQVIGSGTNLDTARLCSEFSRMYDLDARNVEALVMGEHGDSEIITWDSATIGGKRIDDVLADNKRRTAGVTKGDLAKDVIQAGWDIFSRKHNTCYGIASSVTAIARSIFFDDNAIYPVSVRLTGQYGVDGVFLSVPTILDHTGAKEIVEIRLAPEELKAFHHSAEVLHEYYDVVDNA